MPQFDPFENRDAIAMQAKRVLRKQMRAIMGTVPAAILKQRSEEVQRRLMQLPAFAGAKTLVLCAVPPTRRGVHTSQLASSALTLGKTVVYPRVDFDAQQVEFRCAAQVELQARGLDTAEAPASAPLISADTIDLIIVPVLAVDPSGVFIGDGSGAYDNALQHCSHAVTVAVAFEFQLIPEAPCTSADVPVAVIVTDQRVIEARGERSAGDGMSSTDRAAKEVRHAKQPDSVAGSVRRAGRAGDRTRRLIGQGP